MECENAKSLIHPYVDGELDAGHVLEVDEHVAHCPACAQAVERVRAVSDAVGSAGLRFSAPVALRERIQEEMRPRSAAVQSSPSSAWKYLALAASLLAVSMLGLQMTRGGRQPDVFVAEAVEAHVRSLMADHLLDVASTDKHTVRPWFTGKIDFAPAVVDLKEHGYPLEGGRLDLLGERPAAALVYQHGKHTINVFVCPAVSGAKERGATNVTNVRGFNVASWSEGGFEWAAVSDMNSEELTELTMLLRAGSG
jgi:anti-sigma factor RsiW